MEEPDEHGDCDRLSLLTCESWPGVGWGSSSAWECRSGEESHMAKNDPSAGEVQKPRGGDTLGVCSRNKKSKVLAVWDC